MRSLPRWLMRLVLVIMLLLAAIWAFGPREGVGTENAFDPASLPEDLDGYLTATEASFSNITPGTEKRIVWAGARGAKTPLAVIYLHGFSATSEEIRPVPDLVAKGLGANLYFTRLAGHGQDGAALAAVTAGDWMNDLAEALAIGRRLGERVLIIGTSTGGTLALQAAVDATLAADVAGIVFISPNLGLRSAAGLLLDLPFVRDWGPLVAGPEQGFVPVNEANGRYWTTRYPTGALVPMAALVRHARGLEAWRARMPALFLYSPADQVIDAGRIPPLIAAWGAPTEAHEITPGPGDDAYAHVLAGDILSPGQTAPVVQIILDWAKAALAAP